MVAREHMLQLVAQQVIETLDVGRTQTLAIGRIGNQHASRRSLGPGAQRLQLKINIFCNAGTLQVLASNRNGLRRNVRTKNLAGDFALCRIVVIDRFKQLAVKVGPLLKGKTLAENAGRDVGRNQRGFDQESARPTHRVNKRTLASPATLQNNSGGQNLIDWSLGLRLAPTAAVQAGARRVQAQRNLRAGDVNVDNNVGVSQPDARTAALRIAVAKPVGDRILNLIGNETRIREIIRIHRNFNCKSLFGTEQLRPVILFDAVIKLIGIIGLERIKRFQNAQRRAAT